MKSVKDTFESISTMIQKHVDEVDEVGHADKFKLAADRFFNILQDVTYFRNRTKITVEDITYLDSYFIFGHGSNTIVHFRVKEAPGWLFGIWLNTSKDAMKAIENGLVEGEFFCQYEDTIDKFKPTASILTADFSVRLDNMNSSFIHNVDGIISFIIKQPYLAFCRDYHAWNYNHEYHSPREAKRVFKKYKRHTRLERIIMANNDAKVLKWVKKYVLPQFKNAEIIDMGSSWFPRYDVFIPYTENKDILNINGPGHYSWFPAEDDPWKKVWNDFIEKLHKRALKRDVYWYAPFHASANIGDRKEKDEE